MRNPGSRTHAFWGVLVFAVAALVCNLLTPQLEPWQRMATMLVVIVACALRDEV